MSKNPDRDAYKRRLIELLSSRQVAYWPVLARLVGGVKSAVMLSQLLYWNGDETVIKREGWILKSVEELEHETGLTRLEQITARNILTNLGVIDSKLKGVPRIWRYRVDLAALEKILIEPQTHSMDEPFNGKPVQHSSAMLRNIERDSRGMFIRKDAQLNNDLEITEERLHSRLPSSSSDGSADAEEEEVSSKIFSEELLSELASIGVYKSKISEIENSGFSEEQLFEMIARAKTDDQKGTPGALLLYRIAETIPQTPMTDEELQIEKIRRSLKKYGIPQ